MARVCFAIIVTSVVSSALAAPATAPDSVPLTVWEQAGVARTDEAATGGVPFPEGAVADLSQLRVLDEQGNERPAQFQALDRWWASPNKSVRWCLVSFPATVEASKKASYTLKLAGGGLPQPPATALKVDEDADGVTVVTGPLKFRVSKKGFNLFDAAWLDADGNGQFTDAEQVIAPSPDAGAILTTHDWPDEGLKAGDRYSSAAGPPAKVVVEERGPVRACVFVQGSHLPTNKAGFAPGVYDYKVRIYAYASQPFVRVFYTLANSRLDTTMRAWPIQSLRLTTKLAGGIRSVKFDGVGAYDVELKPGEDVVLAQDVEHSAPQRMSDKGPEPYFAQSHGKRTRDLAAGRRASGVIDVANDRFGLAVGMKYFAEMCPKSLKANSDSVSVGLFPAGDKNYYILPGMKRTHELVYLFHAAKDAAASLRSLAAIKDQELRPLAPPAWYQASRAWFGGMSVLDPARVPHAQVNAIEPTGLFATWYGFGWFGRDWNGGGQHPHHDSAALPWLLTGGDAARYREAEALCRWTADLGIGSIMDIPPDMSVLNKQQWDDKKLHDFYIFMGGGGYDSAETRFKNYRIDLSYKTFPGGPKLSSGGPFEIIKAKIDSGHEGLISLHEFYRLTGDRNVLETMDAMAAISRSLMRLYVCNSRLMFVEKDDPDDPSYMMQDRYCGWPLYEIAEAYSRTGDPVFAREAQFIVKGLRNRARTSPVGFITSITPAKANDGYARMVASRDDGAAMVDAVFQTGIAANGLAMYARDAADDEGLDALLAFADNVTHFAITRDAAGKMKGWQYVWSDTWTPGGPNSPFNGFSSSAVRVYRPLAEAYNATGREDYRAVSTAAFEALGGKLDPTMGMEMHSAFYPHQCPKADCAPPAAVADLRAEAVGDGKVRLSWTAPGDDGAIGRAARYQLKYSPDPIVERVAGWPDRPTSQPQDEKHWIERAAAFMARNGRPFWSAVNATGEPVPADAGAKESMEVAGLKPGRCRFAIKSYDAQHNQSGLSNIAEAEVK